MIGMVFWEQNKNPKRRKSSPQESMTPESSSKPQQNIPKWLGPVIIVGAVLMAIHGRPSPGIPQWVAYAACAAFLLVSIALTAQGLAWRRSGESSEPHGAPTKRQPRWRRGSASPA
jgi:hypothetical protein